MSTVLSVVWECIQFYNLDMCHLFNLVLLKGCFFKVQ